MTARVASRRLGRAIESIRQTFDDFMLAGPAALEAQCLSNSLFDKQVDVVIDDAEFSRLFEGDDVPAVSSFAGSTVRVWPAGSLGIRKPYVRVWSDRYSCWCVDPERNLEVLGFLPDAQYTVEDRARLAVILYHDRMTDDELMECYQFVRGI